MKILKSVVQYAARTMLSIMVINEYPMNKYNAAQRWTAFANCPVNLCESLMRYNLTVAGNRPDILPISLVFYISILNIASYIWMDEFSFRHKSIACRRLHSVQINEFLMFCLTDYNLYKLSTLT